MTTSTVPTQIPMTPVTSGTIAAIGYDAETQTLAVQFMNGHTYHYKDVPPELYADFAAAESKGAFFGAHIRMQCQQWARITGPCDKCGDLGVLGERCTDCGAGTYSTTKPHRS